MAPRPFLKFFPSDWRADPRLRMCSLAARGLWIDLISYMHEGQPYGHLTIDGVIPDLQGISALVARPMEEVSAALLELEQRQVFSRSPAGAIFSRRMLRDYERSEEGRMHAARRYDPGGGPIPSGGPNGYPNGYPNGGPSTHIPYSRVQIDSKNDLFGGMGVENVDNGGKSSPRHGAVSRRYGTIFIRQNTEDWRTYANDFKEVRGAEPLPNRHGGYWFMLNGERTRKFKWAKAG